MLPLKSILNSFITSNFHGTIYSISRATVYGCSFASKFVPTFAIFKHTGSLFLGNREIIYHHLHPTNEVPVKTNYSTLYYSFCNNITSTKYKNKDGIFLIRKGLVTDENFNIKIALCFKNFKKVNKNSLTIDDLILIVNKEYSKSLLFKYFNKKDCFKDLDILLTDNVEEYCFKSPKIIPKFKDIAVMQQHLNDVNKLLLSYGG